MKCSCVLLTPYAPIDWEALGVCHPFLKISKPLFLGPRRSVWYNKIMRRPGYLLGCGSDILKPKHFGDTIRPPRIQARDAMYFLDRNSPLPPEAEVGYIPEYVLYSRNMPHGLRQRINRFNPRPLKPGVPGIPMGYPPYYLSRPSVRPRDPRTFNTLMI